MSTNVPRISQVAPDSRRVLVLRNPKAGSGQLGQRFEELMESLRSRRFDVEVLLELDRLSDRACRLFESGDLRTVLAAGGDGTAETVANRIPAEVPLSIFPLGTENLLAKYLGIAADPAEITELIAGGHVACLDAGRICAADQPPRLFLLMIGFGFDADVVRRLHQERTGHINHLSYAKPIVESIRSYQYPTLTVTCRKTPTAPPSRVIAAHWVFVFNTPSYAAGLAICPEADPFDGRLDVTTFEGGSFWHGLMHVSAVMLGQHRNLSGVDSVATECLTVEAEEEVSFQADGDPGGNLPVDIQVLPNRLSVMVPSLWLDQVALNAESS